VTLPMFPLGTVLVPGAVLPLHVFEPRYRQLVQDCLDGTPEFGVVLIERGHEVGGGDSRFDVGCVARILDVRPFPDGRYALAAVGDRRIRIEEWLPDDPYPRATVVDWPDEGSGEVDPVPVTASLRRVLAMAAELGEPVASATDVDVADDPVLASYQLTALAPLGPLDRLTLLAAPGPAARLELLAEQLDEIALVLASRLGGG